MMTSNNKLLLNYLGDAVIYSSDLAILESPTAWLNSDIIHFWFLRLKNGGGESDDDDAGNLQVDCLPLDPAVISFIMHQLDESDEDYEDEVSNLMSTWNLEQQQCSIKRLFLPINDEYGSSSLSYTQGQQQASGSHWSLLLVDIVMSAAAPPVHTTQQHNNVTMPEIKFYHCDSHRGYNQFAAHAVANKVKRVFLKHYSTGDNDSTAANVTECQVPQQSNGFDCGLYTLGFAEALLRLSKDNPCGGNRNKNDGLLKISIETSIASYMSEQINFASNLRKRIREDIQNLVPS
jgi:hypothetical protein